MQIQVFSEVLIFFWAVAALHTTNDIVFFIASFLQEPVSANFWLLLSGYGCESTQYAIIQVIPLLYSYLRRVVCLLEIKKRKL